MADSVRFVIYSPNSFKADSVRWSPRKNVKSEFQDYSHLWASSEAAAPMIEIFVLLLFVLVAIAAIVGCFVELTHLLDSDALGHVAVKALQGGI
jgi:hypothetical protein